MGPISRERRFKIGLGWIIFLCVCALLIWVATWLRPPRPVRLVLVGAGYEDNLAIPIMWPVAHDAAQA